MPWVLTMYLSGGCTIHDVSSKSTAISTVMLGKKDHHGAGRRPICMDDVRWRWVGIGGVYAGAMAVEGQ